MSEIFEQSNFAAQNYSSEEAVVSAEDTEGGIDYIYHVRRRITQESNGVIKHRVVKMINGIWVCSSKQSENRGGRSWRHIQCAHEGVFDSSIFVLVRWHYDEKLEIIEAVSPSEKHVGMHDDSILYDCKNNGCKDGNGGIEHTEAQKSNPVEGIIILWSCYDQARKKEKIIKY